MSKREAELRRGTATYAEATSSARGGTAGHGGEDVEHGAGAEAVGGGAAYNQLKHASSSQEHEIKFNWYRC